MPIKKIVIPPGISRESTQQASGSAWYEGNNVRWRDQFTQSIGGWNRDGTIELEGFGRGINSWTDFEGNQYQIVGTNYKFYMIAGTDKYDITPMRGAIINAVTQVTTTSGSSIVSIAQTGHGALINDFVVFKTVSASVDGIPTTDFTSKTDGFQILEIVDDNNFKVDLGGTLASAGGTFGPTIEFYFQIHTGTTATSTGNGWGVGLWGGDDYLPTEFNFAATPVTTTAASKLYTLDITGWGGSPAFVAGDYVYVIGLTGTHDGVDLTYLNNKWWEVTSMSGADPQITGVVAATAGAAGGGGSSGTFYRDDIDVGTVDGADRGWGDSSGAGVSIGSLRTVTVMNFGEDLMVANRGGPIYYYDTSSKTSGGIPALYDLAIDLGDVSGSSNPPTIIDSFIISEGFGHTIAFGCNDLLSPTQNRMLIRWSDAHNPFQWTPSASTEAGGEVLRHGSEILGAIPTKDEIIIFTDSAVYSMRYIGYPEVYGVSLLSNNVTSYSRMSAIAVDNSVFFMGNEQFYMYDGSVRSLPKNLSNYVFENINRSQKGKVFAAVNSAFTEVMWFYPGCDSFECNRYVSFNYTTGVWGMGLMDMDCLDETAGGSLSYCRTAWDDSGVFGNPVASFITEYDPTSTPVSLKSGIMKHEFGTSAQGQAITHSIESGEVDLDDGYHYAFYDKIIPDVQLINVDDGVFGSLSVEIGSRNLPGKTKRDQASVTVDFSPQTDTTLNYAPDFNATTVRGRGRSVSLKVSSDGIGFGWRLGDIRIRLRPDGKD